MELELVLKYVLGISLLALLFSVIVQGQTTKVTQVLGSWLVFFVFLRPDVSPNLIGVFAYLGLVVWSFFTFYYFQKFISKVRSRSNIYLLCLSHCVIFTIGFALAVIAITALSITNPEVHHLYKLGFALAALGIIAHGVESR